jgi:hypothetical protein
MGHKLKYCKLSRSGIVLITKRSRFQAAVPSTE